MTLPELQEYLATQVDEVSVLELLNITSEELAERFIDRIEERFDILILKLDLEEDIND